MNFFGVMEARLVLFFFVVALLVHLVEGKTPPDCSGCDPVNAGRWARRMMTSMYGRRFRSLKDECIHRKAFEANLAFIADFFAKARVNPGIYTWRVGENSLADMTPDEVKGLRGFKSPIEYSRNISKEFFFVWDSTKCGDEEVFVDYTAKGYVTPVKNQFQCGACWAFSATGAMEAQIAMGRYGLPNLSEQNLIDCSNSTYNTSGCDGGHMNGAFKFVEDNNGIVATDDYPYTGIVAPCSQPNNTRRYSCRSHQVVEPDEKVLLRALLRFGPISCGIDAGQTNFVLYTGGIYSDQNCGSELNHAVLIVGAGRDADGTPYWLCKNSWGTLWGEDGYFRLLRGKNMCNIVGECSFPCNCKPVE